MSICEEMIFFGFALWKKTKLNFISLYGIRYCMPGLKVLTTAVFNHGNDELFLAADGFSSEWSVVLCCEAGMLFIK